jgi:hypothetical protein
MKTRRQIVLDGSRPLLDELLVSMPSSAILAEFGKMAIRFALLEDLLYGALADIGHKPSGKKKNQQLKDLSYSEKVKAFESIGTRPLMHSAGEPPRGENAIRIRMILERQDAMFKEGIAELDDIGHARNAYLHGVLVLAVHPESKLSKILAWNRKFGRKEELSVESLIALGKRMDSACEWLLQACYDIENGPVANS